ncbi:MAG: hypothetical protein OER21_04135 [Gemmatimonadota bacterium]|nr:hypothetical protein [Gemmatimonadota bacterium]
MGDYFELLLALAFILFGILGSRKKKKPSPPTRRPQARPARPAARPPSRAAPQPRGALRDLLEQLEQAAQGGLVPPPARVPDPDEAVSLETLEVEESALWMEGLDRGTASVETLEPAGGKSHVRFHEKYLDAPAPAPPPAPAPITNRDLRRAVIWSEILAPPVSMR